MARKMKSSVVEAGGVAIDAKTGAVTYGLIKKISDICENANTDMLLGRLMELRDVVDEAYFEMGGILRKIYSSKLYMDWGYSDWKTFVEDRLGYSIRKSQYLMSIWHYFAVEIGDEEIIRKITPMGWGKLKECVGIIDPSNVDEWVKKAMSMTITELSKAVADKMMTKGKYEKTGKQISFSLYDEQFQNVEDAIELAKSLSGSEIRSNNLSLIALDYLAHNGGLTVKSDKERQESIASVLKTLEIGLGIKIIAIAGKRVIYGEEYVEEDAK